MKNFGNILRSKIVRIGNSQGIRIPHIFLKQLHLDEEVEIAMQDDQIIIRQVYRPRFGWEERFKLPLPSSEVDLALEDFAQLSDWEGTEWKW